jgi:hypothetical protein
MAIVQAGALPPMTTVGEQIESIFCFCSILLLEGSYLYSLRPAWFPGASAAVYYFMQIFRRTLNIIRRPRRPLFENGSISAVLAKGYSEAGRDI